MSVPTPEVVGDRVLTVPNLLSALRLLGVPVFLWLVLGPEADGAAVLLLVVSGATDYLDGCIARRLEPDLPARPAARPAGGPPLHPGHAAGAGHARHRPLVAARRSSWPGTWCSGCALLVLRGRGVGPLPVHYLGKAATLNLLYAFPLLLLGDGPGAWATVARVVGWAFAIWGTGSVLVGRSAAT